MALDLFVPHRDGGQSIILWNDGKGHFPTSTKVGPATAWIRMGAASDFDGDGRLDLAFIDGQKQAAFVIYNRGKRQFGEPERLPGPPRPPYALALTDLNHDGRPDIVVAMWRRRGRCTSTRPRTIFTKSVGMTARAPCMGWRSRISTATAGQTSWLPVLTRRMRSGSAPNQCQADSGGSRRLAAGGVACIRR